MPTDNPEVTQVLTDIPVRAFTPEWLERKGFQGFEPFLTTSIRQLPKGAGVYAIVRPSTEEPSFLPSSCGGRLNGKDPTVAIDVLERNWVPNCAVMFIGKADSLRNRVRQYQQFGQGREAGHWSGRYIWQLADFGELQICWRGFPGDPMVEEHGLLADFELVHDRLPFANLAH